MRKFIALLSAMFMIVSVSWSQTKTITGKIKDEKDGSPLAGVSIVVKGTTTGTTTGNDGSFSLNVPAGAKTLVVFH